jgi:hypothetical protein
MAGSPSEAELEVMLQNVVDILETARAFFDDTVAPAGGLLDTAEQSAEGEFAASGIPNAADRFRSFLSSAAAPSTALDFLRPILFEYGRIITDGSGYTDLGRLSVALYEHFVTSSKTVQSRAIIYDTSVTTGHLPSGAVVGSGTLSRLTVDENGFDLEACTVETKRWRCRNDQSSGTQKHAEAFEVLGDAASPDNLLRAATGSGSSANPTIISGNAGGGLGGSILNNSSFSAFASGSTPKFTSWIEESGGTNISQDTTNTFRGSPGTTDDASMKITGDGTLVTVTQSVEDMRLSALDPDTPYFFRVMVNPTIGSALGGSFTIRLGSQSVTTLISSLIGGWEEILIPADQNTWFNNFNVDNLTAEIEWSSSTSGFLLVDDAILKPYDLIDGTYWCLRGGATPWKVDDTLEVEDTGGLPSAAKIQWWYTQAGLGYLPSSGTPTLADPA